ncbi:hypothetical protein EJ02DRAFT_417714 [Clathrospora elynae]|uniref:Cenp-s complex centromere protein x protein n=1 Tax=Clathrospora elynae TaxID=706981 RepID=A0A6A5T774_9PLEO|nr:hypothetical protein EJ02DRAFT_417714 [Clathrospora elynae]
MPPKNATANAARRKGPQFNPPRPVNAPSQGPAATKRAPAAKKPNAPAAKAGLQPAIEILASSDEEEEEDDFGQDVDSDDLMDEAPARNDAAPATPELAEPVVPRPLLARLLLENFDDPDMQIQTGAMKLVGKYVDIFVTEAFLRSKDERKASAKEGGIVDGFLQVEDLEKLAPQLVLDF